jgi:hypothetical protein
MEQKTNDDIWLLLGQMDSKLDRVVADAGSQDKRIDKLESAKNFERGIAATLGALGSFIVTYIFKAH